MVLTDGLLCCDHLGKVGELDDPVKDGGDEEARGAQNVTEGSHT